MIELEIKKIYKSKLILFTILFAIIMSFYVNYRSNNSLDLSSEYSSYEHSTADGIFTMNFVENKYKIMDKENYFSEFNDIFKYTYDNYPKLQDFIKNIDKKSFKERLDISKEFFDLSYKFMQKAIKYNEKFGLNIEDETDFKTFKYGIFEMDYIKKKT
ncbi:hypothetical protein ABGF48_08360 [Helcococcus bovis]|uniref:hypothetical protein n=1 Tax=Helcococcus bovis TaxID=3153252 RepID=UPI0038B80948